VQVACDIPLESSQWGLQLCFRLISIKGLHAKLWAPKVAGVPIVGILGLPLGSHGTKCHLDASPVANQRVYYKGEGGGFPQVRVVVIFVNLKLLVVRPNIKSVSTMHLPTCCFVCVDSCEWLSAYHSY
jgi:hypothetical protein